MAFALFYKQVHSVYVVKDLRNWTALIDKHNQLVKIRERIKVFTCSISTNV